LLEGEVPLEAVETALPQALVEREPRHDVVQPLVAEPALPRPADVLGGDETGILQHLDVLLEPGERHAGRRRELADRGRALPEPGVRSDEW